MLFIFYFFLSRKKVFSQSNSNIPMIEMHTITIIYQNSITAKHINIGINNKKQKYHVFLLHLILAGIRVKLSRTRAAPSPGLIYQTLSINKCINQRTMKNREIIFNIIMGTMNIIAVLART